MPLFRARRKQPRQPDFVCPCCGATVRGGAHFCRECGASEESGWGDRAETIPDIGEAEEDFDYDDFLRREFPEYTDAPPPIPWTTIVVVALIFGLLLGVLWPLLL